MRGHSDDPDWRREHAVDHADYLDALLDPDDPLHAVAVEGQGSGDSDLVGIARTLLIKEPWASLILDGKKTWELRRSQTEVRGVVGITPSGSGQVAGQAELVDVHGPFTPEELKPYRNRHQVDDAFVRAYDTGDGLYAWEFRDAHRYDTPTPYDHPQGAVIWVKLAESPHPDSRRFGDRSRRRRERRTGECPGSALTSALAQAGGRHSPYFIGAAGGIAAN